MAYGAKETVPRQFRLRNDTLADLDAVAAFLSERDGRRATRSDAVRFAARQAAQRLEKSRRKR
jgi:hypothetical protein